MRYRATSTGAASRMASLLLAAASVLVLAGCADVDESLFGASEAPPPPTASQAQPAAPLPGTLPSAGGTVESALSPTITPIAVETGPDTGTAVNKTIQSLRGQLSDLNNRLGANAQKLADLRTQGAQAASDYQTAKAHITTRLQVGTTRGNPELVSEWNVAQSALDQVAANINALNALGTDVTNDSSAAHFVLNQTNATFDVSGAVDEDHRQLSVLEDQTNPTGVAYSGTPLVVIKFDHPDVDYQQILYAALTQALQARPSAAFSVVAVSPTRGSAAAVQLAQTAAERHAQEVLRSMTDMGVPATRLNVAAATDPSATTSEVRVFVR